MTTLLPTMKLTLLSYATVQISSQNHSCLLCQSRKNKMHMEEEAGQTLDKKTFLYFLIQKGRGKSCQGNEFSEYFLSVNRWKIESVNIFNIFLFLHSILNKWGLSIKGIPPYSETAELNTENSNCSNYQWGIHPWDKNTVPSQPVFIW